MSAPPTLGEGTLTSESYLADVQERLKAINAASLYLASLDTLSGISGPDNLSRDHAAAIEDLAHNSNQMWSAWLLDPCLTG